MRKLSVIIPSYKRLQSLEIKVLSLLTEFERLEFHDYEIISVVSGDTTKLNIESPHVNILYYTERLYPGIARNMGFEKSNGEWIWFIDDDDEIDYGKLTYILDLMSRDIDLIAHSLKSGYHISDVDSLLKNIVSFREKQEVFNFVIKSSFLKKLGLKFSDGLHEDISFSANLLVERPKTFILHQKVYNKITNQDSITRHLNQERIDGYLKALLELLYIDSPLIKEIEEEITTQCIGTVLYLISLSEKEKRIQFLEYLKSTIPHVIVSKLRKDYRRNNTNFKWATSLFMNEDNLDILNSELEYCFNSYLSCKDLKKSIFLGPQEIIGCCKRFFYEGKIKGDIVLMSNTEDINLQKILDRKKEVEYLINSDCFEDCVGCPYIQRYDKGKEEKIDYISLENFTYCNMRCNYCSPKYYGGREPSYDTDSIIHELLNHNHLSENVHVVWGGGEPTLKPKFDYITNNLLQSNNISKVRVLSNSLSFSKYLHSVCNNDKIRIVTSIDAGSQDKFKEVRGKGNIKEVLKNLSIYSNSMSHPENLTIKYIMTEDNYHTEELQEFVSTLLSYNFENNLFQISCNFKLEEPTKEMILSIYELAARLLCSGFKNVFFDDLIRDRLDLHDDIAAEIIKNLESLKITHENIVSKFSQKKVILWGNGYQSTWIKTKTTFGRSNQIVQTISKTDDIIEISDDYIICPAAIQSIPEILKEINKTDLKKQANFLIFI